MSAKINENGIVTCAPLDGYDKVSILKNDIIVGENLIVGSSSYTCENKLTRTASKSDDYIHTSMTVNLLANTIYTMSFYTTGSISSQTEVGLMYDNGYSYYKFMSGIYHYLQSNGIYYHNESFTVSKSGSYNIRCDWNVSGETHSFWNFKIEEGSKATPWCPNPEDGFGKTPGIYKNPIQAKDFIEN